MTADSLHYLAMAIVAFALFGGVLAWVEWYSNRS